MRPDPERVSLDLIRRKLAEVSDEELATLVGAERLVGALNASGADTDGQCEEVPCRSNAPLQICTFEADTTCHCCPFHRCEA